MIFTKNELPLWLTGAAEEPRPAGVRAQRCLWWGPRTAQGEADREEEAAPAQERSRAAGGQQTQSPEAGRGPGRRDVLRIRHGGDGQEEEGQGGLRTGHGFTGELRLTVQRALTPTLALISSYKWLQLQ